MGKVLLGGKDSRQQGKMIAEMQADRAVPNEKMRLRSLNMMWKEQHCEVVDKIEQQEKTTPSNSQPEKPQSRRPEEERLQHFRERGVLKIISRETRYGM